jgi:DNA repair exonuclease SbcCD ATPase subunit
MTTSFEDPQQRLINYLSKIQKQLESCQITLPENDPILPHINNAIAQLKAAINVANTQLDQANNDFYNEWEN